MRTHRPLLRIVEVPGATRVNTSIIDADGATTKVNAPTPPLSAEAWDATIAALRAELAARTAPWLVISGSLPELAGTGRLVDLDAVRAVARESGARVAVDTSGAALDAVLADPAGVDLLTPNAEELSAAVGRPLGTLGDVVAAAREVIARGVGTVVASLGADGLVAVTADRAVFARADAPVVANTAGAGMPPSRGSSSASRANPPRAPTRSPPPRHRPPSGERTRSRTPRPSSRGGRTASGRWSTPSPT